MTRNRFWVLLYDHTWDKQRRVYVDQAEDMTDASIQAEQSYPGYAVIAVLQAWIYDGPPQADPRMTDATPRHRRTARCTSCSQPLFPQGLATPGDEVILGWPVCVNEACPAYGEERSSVSYRDPEKPWLTRWRSTHPDEEVRRDVILEPSESPDECAPGGSDAARRPWWEAQG